ncbi:GDYXXLXY domain-containing protein [Bordetella bronchialis]|uniref:GDYXXLXY domain-containing protein n=1 Tax=Bordetella bronchialis TaxID=463025 RepID=UPI003CFCA82D
MQVDTRTPAGSELHAWRAFLGRATLALGLLLLASAAVCWVAANWDGMSKIQRLAGAQALLAASALLAAWLYARPARTAVAAHGRACVVGLASVLLGALLALVGQTYQTGADTWELFALWTVLLLPWAVAARSQGVWLLWIILANIALALLLGERVLSWWAVFDGPGFPSLVVSAADLLMLAVWELCARRWHARTGVGPRVLALLAVGVLALALVFGESVVEGLGTYTGLAWVGVTLILGYFYTRIRLDLVILALLAAGVICVSLRVVGEWLLRIDPGVWVALPLAALLMGEAVIAARWLRRLAAGTAVAAAGTGTAADAEVPAASAAPATAPVAEPAAGTPAAGTPAAVDAAAAAPAAAPETAASAGGAVEPAAGAVVQLGPQAARRTATPWYVQGLLGLSAWIATLLLLLFLVASGIVQTTSAALVLGLVLCVAGVAVARNAQQLFWRQCATALAFCGQILVVAGLSVSNSATGAALLILVLAIAVYVLAPDAILRFLSGLMMALALFILTSFSAGTEALYENVMSWMGFDMVRGLTVWLPACVCGAWLAAAAFLARERMQAARRDMLQPLAWAFALAAQLGALQATGVPVWELGALWALHPPGAAFLVLAALLPVAVGWALMRARRGILPASVRAGVPLGLLVLAVCWMPAPGIAFALAWILLGFGLGRPRLRRFGQTVLLIYLVLYYYQLAVPLLQKSVWLAVAGVLLLAMRLVAWRLPRLLEGVAPVAPATPFSPRRPLWAAVMVAGLAAVLAVVNTGIWQREQLLAAGHVVRLALAPVDPRAFMQGDYMALRFAAAQDIARLQDGQPPAVAGLWGGPRTDGYLVLKPDAQGVAQPLRVQADPQPHDPAEVVLRYRVRADGVRLVTNAYFFPEGEGARYEQARYGEFRVGDDGTGLLVRLLNADLQPL